MMNHHLALVYLASHDKTLAKVIAKVAPIAFEQVRQEINFEAIVKVIIDQQLSSQAANTIFSRIKLSLGQALIMPEMMTANAYQLIRSCGVSKAKTEAIYSCAKRCQDDPLFLQKLTSMDTDEALKTLQSLQGIGGWSARIICMFYLNHDDVFAFGDAALNRAIGQLYGDAVADDKQRLMQCVEVWSPYKTYACEILWRWCDQGMPDL